MGIVPGVPAIPAGARPEAGVLPSLEARPTGVPAAGTNIVINNQTPSGWAKAKGWLFPWCHRRPKVEQRLVLGQTETTVEAGPAVPPAGTEQAGDAGSTDKKSPAPAGSGRPTTPPSQLGRGG
jgi:hypothetical protein